MTRKEFREELKKLLPGYKWTVHQPSPFTKKEEINDWMEATGSISSGSNRISTMVVTRSDKDNRVKYIAQSSGFGFRGGESVLPEKTLARAVRALQDLYEHKANLYHTLAMDIQYARPEKVQKLRRAL
ncbi:hypothetical protein Dalk_4607 [Desulfatibacillum aliphaticivorans]|uniref:Uncharacterized protein n=1 Tax=Desulfatibacillum aliphaticivorans TaxID=218208 RepID=B8FNK4_DESAL|nr:hypothetical protein [Desulfatibacillum aliphaticivorans]ACL06285.1 hypothetical protein Dalk_4607 [Desulfatibacillum aliphaticivorans]